MSTVKIDYSDLSNAAKQAAKAADEMREYASKIPSAITSPLGALEGGASSYTSSAANLAGQKAKELSKRAAKYDQFSSTTKGFVQEAQAADSRVKSKLNGINSRLKEGMSFWDQFACTVYDVYCSTIGSTELGAFLQNIANCIDEGYTWARNYLKKAYDWFVYGEGKYVLNIAISVLAAVGAVCAAILSFPVSGIFAAIMAGLAIISAVVAVVDTIATVTANAKALNSSNTEPGLARYSGSVSSASDYAKKFSTSKKSQSFWAVFDLTGKIAGIASSFGKNFVHTVDGTKMGTLRAEDLKKNFAKNFGFKFDVDKNHWSFKPGMAFGLDGFWKQSEEGNAPNWVKAVEKTKNVTSPVKNGLSFFDKALEIHHSHSASILDITEQAGNAFKGFKDINKVLSPLAKGLPNAFGWLDAKVSVSVTVH